MPRNHAPRLHRAPAEQDATHRKQRALRDAAPQRPRQGEGEGEEQESGDTAQCDGNAASPGERKRGGERRRCALKRGVEPNRSALCAALRRIEHVAGAAEGKLRDLRRKFARDEGGAPDRNVSGRSAVHASIKVRPRAREHRFVLIAGSNARERGPDHRDGQRAESLAKGGLDDGSSDGRRTRRDCCRPHRGERVHTVRRGAVHDAENHSGLRRGVLEVVTEERGDERNDGGATPERLHVDRSAAHDGDARHRE